MKLKLSIVVPAYNVEKYMRRCLDSLVSQTLKEIEIIVVNDGSTDNTLNIIIDYAEKYKNVILINQKNQGLSCARNNGMNKAKGEYITFVDADDWLELDTYKYIYEIAQKNSCDVVQFNYSLVDAEKISKNNNNCNIPSNVVFGNEDIKVNIKEKIIKGNLTTYAWDKIYKLDFLKSNNISFENTPRYEDWYFNLEVIDQMKRYIFIDRYYYNYRILNNSLSKKLYKNKDLILVQLHSTKKYYMKKWKMNTSSYIKDYNLAFLNDIFNYVNELFTNSSDISLKLRYQKIRNLVHSNLINKLDIRDLMKDMNGSKVYNGFVLVCVKYKLAMILWILLELYFKIIS